MSISYSKKPSSRAKQAVANIRYQPFWQSTIDEIETPKIGPLHTTEVLIIGAGFTGLWSAIQLQQRFNNLSITIIDKSLVAGEATSRNGGFIHQTLTHGFENSLHHWPQQTAQLIELGKKNFYEIKQFIKHYEIDCQWVDSGELEIALTENDVQSLQEQVAQANSLGLDWQFLSRQEIQQRIHNPNFQAASFDPEGVATINPAKLAHGLCEYLKRNGVDIFQHTEVISLRSETDLITVEHTTGTIHAKKVIVATGAHFFAHPLSKMRTIPIYDYCIVSKPLSTSNLNQIGWDGKEGVIDTGNQFHYYRLTADNRILWGGYAANYHFGNTISDTLTYQQNEFEQLAQDFFELFPALINLDFEYGWGGVIDTCSRFVPFFQLSHRNSVAQAVGFTGLGVATGRFAADVMIDLLWQEETERTQLDLVQQKPFPFPPEPLRTFSIWLTRKSLLREDRTGRRNLWLRLLDFFGIGFDS